MSTKQAYYADAGLSLKLVAWYFSHLEGAKHVLDIGCGTGHLGRFAPVGVQVHGVDNDGGAVAVAARWEDAIQLDLDSDPLPYDTAYFDAVVAKDILEHVADPLAVMGEIARVLRPGGVAMLSVIRPPGRFLWSDYTHRRAFTRRSARLLVEDAGLQFEAIWRMGPLPLAQRLNLLHIAPVVLRFPGIGAIWASSWEVKARRPAAR